MQYSQEHLKTMVYAEFGGKQSVLWAIGKQRMPIYEEPLLSGQPPLISGHLPVPRGIFVPVTYCFLFPSPLVVLKNIIKKNLLLQNRSIYSAPFLRHPCKNTLLYTLLNINQPTPSLSRQIDIVWQH